MRTDTWLARSQRQLEAAGIATVRLDCLVLLEDALGQDRAYILAHPEAEIDHLTEMSLNKKIVQRTKHIPLAYVRGKAHFYGREFFINQHVLVPRPETETMIDLLLRVMSHKAQVTIADIGTGSGAIAVTVKLELPHARVIATDLDRAALKIAKQNSAMLKADIQFLQGDLLVPIRNSRLVTRNSILLANLPYVPERYTINQAAEHEPKHAIFGGKDGLNLYRRLWQQIVDLGEAPKCVLTEALPTQHQTLAKMAETAGYRLIDSQDFVQVFERYGLNRPGP